MVKRIIIAVAVISLALVLGCSTPTGSTTSSSIHEIVKKSTISQKWQMYQMKLNLPGGTEYPLLLKLADGDKVDGHFFLEKGAGVDFRINAASLLYTSQNPSGKVTSDRFSFVASQAQGNTYILTFRNNASDEKDVNVVFLEVVYPTSGSIFIPLEVKLPK